MQGGQYYRYNRNSDAHYRNNIRCHWDVLSVRRAARVLHAHRAGTATAGATAAAATGTRDGAGLAAAVR